MYKKRLLHTVFVLLALSICGQAMAEDTKRTTLEDALPRGLLEDHPGFLTFTIENDNFGDGSDENYTNGVRLTYFDTSAELPWFSSFLDSHLPIFEINDTTSVYYSFGQNLYTPEDIEVSTPDPKDRPYAAFLYASAGLTTLKDDHIDEIEATLGVVGPWALGEEVQTVVHKVLDSSVRINHQHGNENAVIESACAVFPAFDSRLAQK